MHVLTGWRYLSTKPNGAKVAVPFAAKLLVVFEEQGSALQTKLIITFWCSLVCARMWVRLGAQVPTGDCWRLNSGQPVPSSAEPSHWPRLGYLRICLATWFLWLIPCVLLFEKIVPFFLWKRSHTFTKKHKRRQRDAVDFSYHEDILPEWASPDKAWTHTVMLCRSQSIVGLRACSWCCSSYGSDRRVCVCVCVCVCVYRVIPTGIWASMDTNFECLFFKSHLLFTFCKIYLILSVRMFCLYRYAPCVVSFIYTVCVCPVPTEVPRAARWHDTDVKNANHNEGACNHKQFLCKNNNCFLLAWVVLPGLSPCFMRQGLLGKANCSTSLRDLAVSIFPAL